ncbi:MAG: cytochrome c1 [Rhodospirillaceae bacterium]|nr:cytochrome c1 [Rhodospirillaceae bacterium]|tara:strand:- start:9597 stop:10364 length:768 start_codon:yes stop_codon:yes gene_type:complete
MRKYLIGAAAAVSVVVLASNGAMSAGDAVKPPSQNWSFSGFFGTFDRGALQRGFQVYDEVCAGCHSARLLAYRNLTEIGFTEDQAKKIAASKEVTDGPNDEGEMFQRPGILSDRFVRPFPNDEAARAANGGALPPDLSLMVKARIGGANYLHALLTGYKDAPKDTNLPDGMSYNLYFAGNQIAMAPPLAEDGVEYADKTKATVDQMARDVTTFLAWAAEPELEWRKRMGVKVILFLLILTGMLYAVKRKVWSDVH